MTGFSSSNFGQQIFNALNNNLKTTKEEKKGNARNDFFSNPVSSGSSMNSLADIGSQVESLIAEANATVEGFNIERNSGGTNSFSSLTSSSGNSSSNFLFSSRMNNLVTGSLSQSNKIMAEIKAQEKVEPLAYALHDAISGLGTDEDTIFKILGNLSPTERAELEDVYNSRFGNGDPDTLRNDLKGDLSGSDQTKALNLLNTQNNRENKINAKALAFQLYDAMDGWGTDEKAVKKIFNEASPQELREIEEAFDEMNNKKGSFRDWIRGEFSGTEERSLLNKLNTAAVSDTAEQKEIEAKIAERAQREPVKDPIYRAIDNANSTVLDVQLSQAQNAKVNGVSTAISDATAGWGTDEKTILDTLQNLKPEQRAELERRYTREGKNLREELRSELSGSDERKAFDLLNEGTRHNAKIAAIALKEAMQGWGTDDKTVKNIMNNASPQELKEIERAFDQMQGEKGALRDWIKGDFSGSDERSLLSKLNNAALAN